MADNKSAAQEIKARAESRLDVDEREDGTWRMYYVLNERQRMPLTGGDGWRFAKNQLAGAIAEFVISELTGENQMRTFSIDLIDSHNNITNMTLDAADFHCDSNFIVFADLSKNNIAAINMARVISVVAKREGQSLPAIAS